MINSRFKLFFAALMILALSTACNKGGDDVTPEDLEGTWELVSAEVDVESDVESDSFEQDFDYEFRTSDEDYEVVFDDGMFTTEGNYGFTQKSTIDGEVFSEESGTYTDIMGSGSYSLSGDVITVQGQFFEYEVSGMPATASSNNEGKANIEITSSGELRISQDEETSTDTNGVKSTTKVRSLSVWKRK